MADSTTAAKCAEAGCCLCSDPNLNLAAKFTAAAIVASSAKYIFGSTIKSMTLWKVAMNSASDYERRLAKSWLGESAMHRLGAEYAAKAFKQAGESEKGERVEDLVEEGSQEQSNSK